MKRELILPGNHEYPELRRAFTILEYDEMPIVFVACDDNDRLYLCNCVESRDCLRWIVTLTNFEILEDLLTKKIGTYEALKAFDSVKTIVTYDYVTKQYCYTKKSFSSISEDDLPAPNAIIRRPIASSHTELIQLKIELFSRDKKQMTIETNYRNVSMDNRFIPIETSGDYITTSSFVAPGDIKAA